MTDSVVELANLTGLTLTDLTAGVPIAKAEAGQQIVVKDVVLRGATRSVSLRVGSATVAGATVPSALTGSEIVGAGTTLELCAETLPLFTSFAWADNGPYLYSASGSSTFSGDGEMPGEFTTQTSTAQAFTPYFVCLGQNGDLYFSNLSKNGSSSTYSSLYRKSGGSVNATASMVIATGVTHLAYDGSRYIWVYSSLSQFMRVDTLDGSYTTMPYVDANGAAFSISGYAAAQAHASGVDGYIVIKATGNASLFYIVEMATGITLAFSPDVPISANTSRYFCSVGKNREGEYVLLWGDTLTISSVGSGTAGVYRANIGKDIAAPVLQSWGRLETTPSLVLDSNVNRLQTIAGAPNFVCFIPQGSPANITVIDLTTFEFSYLTVPFGTTLYGFHMMCDQAKAVKAFGTINVRATGVLSK
ncbi:hypothetical protein VPH49_22020 [Pseudomonas luteola]|uniref:hypothetical protein n=1 Tax=Pseudomonas luteola TaxID=47886 RepID=UPI003A83E794